MPRYTASPEPMPINDALGNLADALSFAFSMFWEILWALILGFALSAVVQAVVSKSEMTAAVALARSLFRKGADFTSAMAFEFASTNLVIELGIILAVLMGWQFTLAEFVGGPLMIVFLAVLFAVFLTPELVASARRQTEKGLLGVMEGHAEMDMSLSEGSLLQRIFSARGFTSISHYFVMDWLSIWRDIALGLLIAGAMAAWVPDSFWRDFFLTSHPTLATTWGPLIGPVVAVVSFVCSIGNVPLAAVLWNGGISFGGVVSFIFADLIVLPILNIYRKYYGLRMTAFLFVTFFTTMVAAGLVVDLVFDVLGLIPNERAAKVEEASITLNAILVVRFFLTGGPAMVRMMNQPAEAGAAHHSPK